MSDYAPIREKCFYWREHPNDDDKYDFRIKRGEKRVNCSCFVEGSIWEYTEDEVPKDCPNKLHCRYYIHFG